ncbi:NACHT domain-containing protein [Actinosynnema sp. NPDC020468]|uniref:NACHT domain-containing protein n=1 Tax=Actinosynnema sp. NPDC020468 TaxID=3154488 RepID=UPI0033F43773
MNFAWLRGVTGFGRHYRAYLLHSLRYIDLKGLAVVGFHTPEFEDVFVHVSLSPQTPHNAPADLLGRVDGAARHAVTDFLDRPAPEVLAIIGVPGSGKTTLLRHLAVSVCRRPGRRWVPVLLYLRDHVAAIKDGASLPSLVRARVAKHGPTEPSGWFEKRLSDGECVVLLDGLDEVADHADRRAVSAWVERQKNEFPANDFVLTSRPHGYRTAPVEGAKVLQVRGFTDAQVARFLRGWYLAIERLSTRETGEPVRLRAEKASGELLAKLQANPNLNDLTVNPLLLTMVANVHRFGGRLPDSRAELYREICEVMLWRRHEAKNLPALLTGDRKEILLRALAFTMMGRRVHDLPRADVLEVFEPGLRRMGSALAEDELLADLASNGLLVERESGVFSFAHQTFREYLAAGHVRDKGRVDVLAARVEDDWWRETTILYTAKSDADPVVAACLESGTVPAVSLALDCAEHAADLSPELRAALDDLVASADRDPAVRRLVAAVLLNRHLRHGVEVADVLLSAPVTPALLAAYRRDTSASSAPGFGVTSADAAGFVAWAAALGARPCRLPTRSELDHPRARRAFADVSVWSSDDLWVPEGVPHPHVVTSTEDTEQTLLQYSGVPLWPAGGSVVRQWKISPEALVDEVTRASNHRQAMFAAQLSVEGERASAALHRVLDQVLTGRRRLTRPMATELSRQALALAREAERREVPGLIGHYRRLAAGVTLLDHRIAGEAPTTESIVLVSDRPR